MAEALQECLAPAVPDVVFVRPKQARMLQRGPARIVLTAFKEINAILKQLSHCKSKEEFIAVRDKRFPDYVNLSYIIANSFAIAVDKPTRAEAVQTSLKAVHDLLKGSDGIKNLGESSAHEAVFCADTMRRAYKLVDEIYKRGELAESLKEADLKLARLFNVRALLAQIHIDCLLYFIKNRIGQAPEVIDEVLQGARNAVMAYSYARQGVELRTKREPYLLDTRLDEEDQELLDESYSDYVEHEGQESRIDGHSA